VLSTILLNLIAATAVSGLVRGALRDPAADYPQSRALPDAVRLAPLFAAGARPRPSSSRFLAAALLAVLLSSTPLGLRLRAVGLAPAASRAIGLPDARLRLLAFAGSGALAGLAGGLEVLAVTGRLYDPFSAGTGYAGLAAALLGQAQPAAVRPRGPLLRGARRRLVGDAARHGRPGGRRLPRSRHPRPRGPRGARARRTGAPP
jgi:ABC-type uncharacterized transport system permease subunit